MKSTSIRDIWPIMEPLGPCLHLMGDPMILIMILVTVFEDLEVQVLHCQVCKKYPITAVFFYLFNIFNCRTALSQ